MPRVRRDGRRHKILAALAAHPDGLISRQLAEQHGEDTGQQMLTRYGGALRALRDAGYARAARTVPSGRQNTPAIVYQITSAGREHLAAIEAPQPEPPERRRAEYPWAADAARRYQGGESARALARDFHVSPGTVQRVLERCGVQIQQRVGRPRRHPRPEWAAEAARRYRGGEPRSALCAAYKVCDRAMIRVLKAEGVTLRSPREAQRLWRRARQHELQPDARLHGIPEYLLRRHPKARAELEARLPRWREAAKAIGELGIGLDDAEYVGGALWYGLTHCGGEGNFDEQKRVIIDRLVRWAIRDGGDSVRAAAAIRSILDYHLAGR
jgi:DNA-binding PadR family transcriptional regulator